ncbi:MAG TPA: cyanophycinase [Thermoanaerobaculia bacterium]|nr:cyanophycinase [Thermoanaerobaculia bacterium]
MADQSVPGGPRGHLLIVGGGPIPAEVIKRFVELAGGSHAHIVVFPMASEDPTAGTEQTEEFQQLGAHAERMVLTHEEADRETSAQRLDGATGIWFGGGDQSNLTKALAGTRTERAIQARYRQGAAIGGTSAGAAAFSSIMLTGDERHIGGERPPSDPADSLSAYMTIARENVITAEGFGFLPGSIVDQHFVRRRRHNRLISLVLEHPELLGLGIDESTAVEVGPDGLWRVLGASVAVVYDARSARVSPTGSGPLAATDVRMHILSAGSVFDPRRGEAKLPAQGTTP